LHLGSLFTALASFLDARANKGLWLLRIDDLDSQRNTKGSASAILNTLEVFGLHWDETVHYQGQHLEHYEKFLAQLEQNGTTYHCVCSRKTLAGLDVNKNKTYPGTCRGKSFTAQSAHAIRLKTQPQILSFTDKLQGLICHNIAEKHGDFILKRRDGIIAYQFAVVVDDYLQNVTHVVRGCDLLEETPKQIYLQQLLGFPTTAYMHVPVIVDQQGYKLSKQTLASAVDTQSPSLTLFDLLVLLKQNPPESLIGAKVNELLDWAISHWKPKGLALSSSISL
jgi:glutamyl-Q tRNA(Asp) synthetase